MNEKPWVKTYAGGKPNYTTPVDNLNINDKRVDKIEKSVHEWVGLTDDELPEGETYDFDRGVRWAEQYLKQKIVPSDYLDSHQQEPVAWVDVKDSYEGPYEFHGIERMGVGKHLLYTTPVHARPVVHTVRCTYPQCQATNGCVGACSKGQAEKQEPVSELLKLMAEDGVTGVLIEVHRGPLSKSIRTWGECDCPTSTDSDVTIEVQP